MKNGTVYAKRVKRLFNQLKKSFDVPEMPEPTDPVEQIVLARLIAAAGETRAKRAFHQLVDVMVDINEIRVSTSMELSAILRPYVPDSLECAVSIRRALNDVFRREHAVRLDVLKTLGRREARHYLESLDGVDHYVAASVMLWSLGGHAIPVDSRLFELMGKENLIDPSAKVADVQAFLERNIGADDAKAFCLLMLRHVSSKGSRPASTQKTDRAAQPKPKKRAAKQQRATPARAKARTTTKK